MDSLDEFVDSLMNEEKENFNQYYKKNNQLLPKGNQQKKNNDARNNNEDEIMGVSKSPNLDLIESQMHEIHRTKKSPVLKQIVVPISRIQSRKENLASNHKQYHHKRSTLSISDDEDFTHKKLKSLGSTSNNEDSVYKGTSNNNCNSNSGDKQNPESDQNLSKIVKDKRIVSHFNNHNSSSDESSEDDEDELEKELTKLRRLSLRPKCVNINDVTSNCKFFIKNFEKCHSTANVDTNHMPQDLGLLKYIKNMKNKLKSVCKPRRSLFYKKLVKTSNNFEVFNLKEYSDIIEDNGMINLFNALKLFEKKHNFKLKFVKSKLGDALKRYSTNRDICWDVVHLESNSNKDLLKYKLSYGAIPKMYVVELETIICRILLGKLYDGSIKSNDDSDDTNKLQNKDYDLLEGELELLIFNYWQISTRDMLGYKEHFSRKKDKMVFYYMFKKLESNIIGYHFGANEIQKQKFMKILKLYKSYAAFEKPSILTAAGLVFVKNSACHLTPFLEKQYDLWSVFFHKFNLHSMAFDFTIKTLLDDRDRIFQYLFTRVSEIDQFNESGSAKSLWYHGITQIMTPEKLENTIISRTDVVNCLSYYFSKPTNVPRAMCVKLDNYYFLYIDLFVSFIINNRLYKYHRKLTAENCNHFFILNDRRYHEYYSEKNIPVFDTRRMVTSMKIMLNNQLNARLDGDLKWNMRLDTEVTHLFFSLVHKHLNYALTPAMLREGPVLTDVQWASIFISDLNKMEMFYLNKSRWIDKPCMLGGAPDDLDYDPETEDLDPLKNELSAKLRCRNVTEDDDGPSSDEETDFNSDDSEDEIIHKILIEKKNERLMAECQYLNEDQEHKLFKQKLSKKIQDCKHRVGDFNKLTPKKQIKTVLGEKKVGQAQLKKLSVNNVKCVSTLKAELEMVAAGVLDIYELKNDERHVIGPGLLKVFGLISKNKFKTSRSSKGCTLCPNSKVASFNVLVSENVAVACCLICIKVVDNIIRNTEYSYEQLQEVLKWRIYLRFKSPLLFDEKYQILLSMPRMLSHNDMYCSTYNKLDPKCGKTLGRIAFFSHYSEHVNRSSLLVLNEN